MRIELLNPGFEGHVLEVETGGLRAAPWIYFDGARAVPQIEPGSFVVRRTDGTDANIVVRRSRSKIDPIPSVSVDGVPVAVRGRPTWIVVVWAALPLLLAAFGPVGAAVGIVAAIENYRIVRLPGGIGRWGRALSVSVVAGLLVGAISLASLGLTGAGQTAAAEHAVQHLHALLDAGQDAQIVAEADPLFTSTASPADAAQFFANVHATYGVVRSSTLNTWTVNQQVATGATGTFLRMDYATHFAFGQATETFTWRIDGGRMSLVGYHLN
jgi:hypothetical protein